MEEARLPRKLVEVALLMFMREVRGVAGERVQEIMWPVYDNEGNPSAIVRYGPAEAPAGR